MKIGFKKAWEQGNLFPRFLEFLQDTAARVLPGSYIISLFIYFCVKYIIGIQINFMDTNFKVEFTPPKTIPTAGCFSTPV